MVRPKQERKQTPSKSKSKAKKVRTDRAARTLGLGFSPCPNDTFMFHALVTGAVEVEDVGFAPELLDIQELNRRALGHGEGEALSKRIRPLVVTKLSIPALVQLTKDYTVLSAGAALGRGNGPLVVRNVFRGDISALDDLEALTVAVPGEDTTAAMLLRIFGPANLELAPMPFHEIMPAVAEGQVDAGVVIHEGRFTYPEHGLLQVQDLGELWEAASGLPLPLGVIAARRDLGKDLIDSIEDGVRGSVEHAVAHPDDSWDYIKKHAQELSEDVCRQHIELYVNDYSKDLGKTGRKAINELISQGCVATGIPRPASPWR